MNKTNPTTAHYISPFLRITENWIYKTIVHQQVFSPIVITKVTQNESLFPFKKIYTLNSKKKAFLFFESIKLFLLGYSPFFLKSCRMENVALLHAHFGTRGVKSIGLKKKLNIPLICSFYGFDAFNTHHVKKHKKAYQRLFKHAEKILALGPYMKNELISQGCPENKIVIQHLGIDTKKIAFKARILDHSKPIRFLTTARFVEKKGLDIVIKAFALLKQKLNFHVEIIGDGELKDSLVCLIKEHNMDANFTLHGFKPYDFFIERTYECDVYILASKTTSGNDKEGTPMSLVDAMAAGMPVVSTRHSDIPEIVIDNYNGFLAEENNITDFANCLMKIVNCDCFEELSINARKHIEAEFDAAVQTKKLEKLYQTVIETCR